MMSTAIELQALTKRFGITKALSDVSFSIRQGSVHALVGENGAGKSSLIKILSGVHQPDGGAVRLFGQGFAPKDPAAAQLSGVSTMFQESQQVSNLSVAENIYLGMEPRIGPFLDWSRLMKQAGDLLGRLGIEIEPGRPMDTLSPSEAKLIEMGRAVSRNAKVLIMDEPTANLNQAEQQILFRVLKQLNEKEGVTVIYISHHMQEVFDLCDQVTVLRDGQHVVTLDVADTETDALVRLMIGRQMEAYFPTIAAPTKEESRLVVSDLAHPARGLDGASFEVARGEIFGIYGLADSGRTALVNALFGIQTGFAGAVRLDGASFAPTSPTAAIEAGVILVPEDRKLQGLMLELDLLHNFSVGNLGRFVSNGLFQKKKALEAANAHIKRLRVKPNNAYALVKGLSGGNQQKVAIGKWLNRDFRLAIFQEPTRGIDVSAKMEVYEVIKSLSEAGVAILVLSSEVLELMGLCHRVGVLSGGRMTATIERADFSEHAIVSAALPRRRA